MIRLRTGYSFRDAYGPVAECMKRIDGGYAPITDRTSSYGWLKWQAEAEKAGKRAVLGVELAVSPSPDADHPVYDWWVVLPATDSLEPINELIRMATRNYRWIRSARRHIPIIALEAVGRQEGVTAAIGRRTPATALGGAELGFVAHFLLQPGLSPAQARRYRRMGLEPLLAGDNVYPDPGDRGIYEIIAGQAAENQTWPRHILSMDEVRECLERQGHSLRNIVDAEIHAQEVLERGSKARMETARLPRPRNIPLEADGNLASLETLCRAGQVVKFQKEWTQEYEDRLTKELELIQAKGYEDYFHIVADICKWARERMLVGPARGSSCGSLVCYLLDITTIDPIPHGLIFERFVDINRDDMPDIDIDFPEHRREEVIDYIRQTYGMNHVSRLGTVSMFRPRSALHEASKALNIPRGFIAPVLDAVIERSSGDARALDTLEDTLNEIEVGKLLLQNHPDIIAATHMEGHPSHASTHASAVVMTREPLEHYAPINERDGVLMIDKKDAEELNILKVDTLGLTQLSVLEYACELAGFDPKILTTIEDLEDPGALGIMRDRKFAGIFQFNGKALLSISKLVSIERFEDIVALTALARPGPLVSGNTERWADKHRDKQRAIAEIPELLRPALEDTFGIVIYQEQVMQIGREVGGLTWGDVTALRKAMSKSLGKEYFDSFGDRWKPGAIAKGMDPEEAEQLWTDMCAFGSWAFNKSHSVAYGLISYWCAWVKARYPVEFAAATLTYEGDTERKRIILRELEAEGVGYVPWDQELSQEKRWGIDRKNKRVVGPFMNIKGIADKMANMIVRSRETGEPASEAVQKRLANAVTALDTLYPVRDTYRKLLPNPETRKIYSEPTSISDIDDCVGQEVMIVGIITRINPRDQNEEINIAKRDGKRIVGEPTAYLTLRIRDDSGEIISIVNRWKYVRVGVPIVKRGMPEKLLYAFKGEVIQHEHASFFMVSGARLIGEMDNA